MAAAAISQDSTPSPSLSREESGRASSEHVAAGSQDALSSASAQGFPVPDTGSGSGGRRSSAQSPIDQPQSAETGGIGRAPSDASDSDDWWSAGESRSPSEEGQALSGAGRGLSASSEPGQPDLVADPEAQALTAAAPGGRRRGGGTYGRRWQAGDRRVLLRFRETVELTPAAIAKGGVVAFVVGFVAIGFMEAGVALQKLDGFFVLCMAAMSVPPGVFYSLKLLKTIWDSHRCTLTKRMLTEEYVVQDLDEVNDPKPLPLANQRELQNLGLW